MKLAFDNKAHYTDYSKGYDLYKSRNNKLDERTYNRIIRAYCRLIAEELESAGMSDLPCGMGTLAAAIVTRKPQYRGKKFIGYGKMDWEKGHYDGTLKAFALVYLPSHGKNSNLRSFGFVANRELFKRMKNTYNNGGDWSPLVFTDEMI